MKKFAIALSIMALLSAVLAYNVWRASRDPVSSPPGPLEIGRQKLHAQLEESAQREAEIEKQDWNTVTLLQDLIKAHEHRIAQLTGNSQAGEILAHDHAAIERLQKRIAELQAQEAAKAAQAAEEQRKPKPEPQQ